MFVAQHLVPIFSSSHHATPPTTSYSWFFLAKDMVEGQTMFLYAMVIKEDIEKVLTRGISIIHTILKTTINKLLTVTVHNQ
jgi:hypothetical protein